MESKKIIQMNLFTKQIDLQHTKKKKTTPTLLFTEDMGR